MRHVVRSEQYQVHSITANLSGSAENEYLARSAARAAYRKIHQDYKPGPVLYSIERVGDFFYDALKLGTKSDLLDRSGRLTQAVRDRRRHDARDHLVDFMTAFAGPADKNPYLDAKGNLSAEGVTHLKQIKRIFDQQTWNGAQWIDQDFALNFKQALYTAHLPQDKVEALEKAIVGSNKELQQGFAGLDTKPLTANDLKMDNSFSYAKELDKMQTQQVGAYPRHDLCVTLMAAIQDLVVSKDLSKTVLRKDKMVADLKTCDKYVQFLDKYLLADIPVEPGMHEQLRKMAAELLAKYQLANPNMPPEEARQAALTALVPVLQVTEQWRDLIANVDLATMLNDRGQEAEVAQAKGSAKGRSF